MEELPHNVPTVSPTGAPPDGTRRLYIGLLLSWLGFLICWLLLNKEAGALARICHAGTGCDAVLSSRYAVILGVPLPWVGLGFYLLIFSLLAVAIGSAKAAWRNRALGAALWMSVAALSFSVLLMWVQFGRLRAFCPLCTASAVVVLVLVITLVKAEAAVVMPPSGSVAASLAGMATLTIIALALSHGGREEVVAIINGRKITRSQMEEELAFDLQPLEKRRHTIEAEWIGKKVDEIVLLDEARRQGMTPQALLTKQMAGVHTPAGKEGGPDLTTNSAATAESAEKRQAAAREAILNEAAGRHDIRVLLPAPKLRAMEVDLTTAKLSGSADAPVKLVVFSDFQCQFCARLAPVLQRLRAEFPNDVMLGFRYFPLEEHPRAFAAAVAAECAAEQNAFWKYHDQLFAGGGDLGDDRLMGIAREVGLNAERFRRCLQDKSAAKLVESSRRDAADAGLEGAPVLFLNGKRVEGSFDYRTLAARVKAELQKTREDFARGQHGR